MATTLDIGTLIARKAGVQGGVPCIAGTRVTVHAVVIRYKQGLSPEEIAEQFGHLSMAQVHAAIAYYHANRDQIQNVMETEQRDHDRLAAEFPR